MNKSRVKATYQSWNAMLQRCTNPKMPNWNHYGGRGITVCERWTWFPNFLEDMGYQPEGKTLERIDVNGNYCPSNCKWDTYEAQANNRRNNLRLELHGSVLTQAQWSRKLGISQQSLHRRLHNGWTVEQALQTPNRRTGRTKKVQLFLSESEMATAQERFRQSGQKHFCDWIRSKINIP